jgi:glycerol-3-phosphate dehydrogenase
VLPPPFSREVVERCCREEWAQHLDDVLMRRTSWHFYHGVEAGLAQPCSTWMARELGWNEAHRAEEVERYREVAGSFCRRKTSA